jgi:hypothetical protein
MNSKFPEFGLGRNESIPDENNGRFQAIPKRDAKNIIYKNHYTDQVLDQGNTPWCVSHAAVGTMIASPIRNWPNISLADLYKLAQKYDRWPGENYDGTSVHGGCIALKSLGLIKEYRWATTIDQVVDYVLAEAPMFVGTVWTEAMFTPDKQGFIHPDGPEAGGHSYMLIAANRNTKGPNGSRGALTKLGSWGRRWGKEDRAGNKNGRALITFDAFEHLLKNGGEAAVIIENRVN